MPKLTEAQVRTAVGFIAGTFALTKHPDWPEVKSIKIDFLDFHREGETVICFWVSQTADGKLTVSDGGKYVRRQPDTNLTVLQDICNDYHCDLMTNMSIMETSDRKLDQRVASMLHCLIVIEGITRVWRRQGEKVAKRVAERKGEEASS